MILYKVNNLHIISKLYKEMQSVSITTNIVSSNPIHSEVYLMQHYVIMLVYDLRQIVGFLWVLRFPAPIKLNTTI
jgi:hypothetical protein